MFNKMHISKDLEQQVWEKGAVVPGRDPEKYRFDEAGAIIYRDKRNDTNMAWEIDHIFPSSFLRFFNIPQDKIDDIANLQPLHVCNNRAKKDDFPAYTLMMISNNDKSENIIHYHNQILSDYAFYKLMRLYSPYFNGLTLKQAIQKYKNKE